MNRTRRSNAGRAGFTLMELLVVIGIMALIGSLVAPSLKRMKSVDVIAAANRQLLDDIAQARRLAMLNRTTVYMVFMPVVDQGTDLSAALSAEDRTTILANQLTAYSMFVRRSAGDQPGREYPRFLTPWRNLPDGIFIPPYKFNVRPSLDAPSTVSNMLHSLEIPVPSTNGVTGVLVPYIAFDFQGSLISGRQDEIIPLARGHAFPVHDSNQNLVWAPATASEDPPNNSVENFNHIRIDWLTGHARIERPEIQ